MANNPASPSGPGSPGASGSGQPAPAPSTSAPPPPLGGYNGRILRVNLSDGSIATETFAYDLCRRYIGGAGLLTYYLWKELKQGVDELGPDNKRN